MGGFTIFSPTGAFAPSVDPFGQLISTGLNILGQYIGTRPGIPSPGQLGGSVPYTMPSQGTMPQLTNGASAGTDETKKHRRMNVLNPYALRRSMRRVKGFAKFASKAITFTHRHKMKKFRGGYRKRRRA